jgi:uncharacterized protein DUF87
MLSRIPADVLKNHIAVVGKAGSGKTYAVKGTAEALIDDGERVCIVDPTGAWSGLRSSATGKSGGYPVVIFGGNHADLPLNAAHGEAIAEVVATSKDPVIIDTSMMRVGERTRFMATFAEAIFRLNKGPLHLFIDEAHVFAPQGKVADPQSAMMLHAVNNLVSMGRVRGFRIVLISQRPAKLHKDSLSQVEVLVAMRMIAPQDRGAIEDWIKDNARDGQDKEILSSLAELPTGTGWIWAPELKILDKIKFGKIKTYDSSATPDGQAESVVFRAIDKSSIELRLKAISVEAVENDPARLKRRVAELEAQIRKERDQPPVSADELKAAEEHGYVKGSAFAFETVLSELDALRDDAENVSNQASRLAEDLQKLIDEAKAKQARAKPPAKGESIPVNRRTPSTSEVNRLQKNVEAATGKKTIALSGAISPSARKILDAIHRAHPMSLSFDAAARRAVISSKSSAYGKYKDEVISSGEVVLDINGRLNSAPGFANPMPEGATVEEWAAKLPPSCGKMLLAIAASSKRGARISRDAVAEVSGISPTSSGLSSGLKELLRLSLIKQRDDGFYELEEGL